MPDPPRDLAGSVALVTGASAGIGLATVDALAARGAHLVLAARRRDAIEGAAARLRTAGSEALALPLHVTDFAAVERAVRKALDRFGRIDHLVNSAGTIEPIAAPHLADPAQWTQGTAANLFGVFHLCRALLPHMLERGSGTMVNIS